MANREDIIEALVTQRDRIRGASTHQNFSKWNKVMQYYFTDIHSVWHLRFVNGIVEGPFEEEIQKPDIYFKMPSNTFCDIIYGRLTGLKAFRQGKLKLKATPAELVKLSKLDS